MAFVVSTLTDYAKENEALLVTSSVLGSKTATLIKSQGNVLVGVKSSEKIGIMDTDAFFQDDSDCGFNASGTTTFTQRSVTVGKIKVQEALCPKGLESKYLQKHYLLVLCMIQSLLLLIILLRKHLVFLLNWKLLFGLEILLLQMVT